MSTLAFTAPQQSLFERVRSAHRFLADHAFYPLVLCTLLGFAFLVTRTLMLGYLQYRFLVWNLFLAWIPYGLSLLAVRLHDRSESADARRRDRGLKIFVWLAWLAMLPNAPYIITDFVHVGEIPIFRWWFDVGMVLTFALTGCFLGIVSLRIMHDLARPRIGRTLGWLFVFIVTALCGFGVYLGRFQRFNSWDIIARPHRVFGKIAGGLADPFSHSRTWGVTLMFGAVMLVVYVMFLSTSRARSSGSSD